MRVFSANLLAALRNKNPFCYLVEISQKAVTGNNPRPAIAYRTTTHNSNITLSDGSTFIADGRLISVDTLRLSSVVDREQFKIGLADPTMVLESFLDYNATDLSYTITGRDLIVYSCFLDSQGLPLTTVSDLLLVYQGSVDQHAYAVETGGQGSSAMLITGSSPMNNLDQKKFFELSKQAVRARNGNDSCCDQIYEGSKGLSLKWGKTA